MGVSMSNFYEDRIQVTQTRLLVLINSASKLNDQISELNELREQVKRAQQSARRWHQTRRTEADEAQRELRP